jgi:hypothetical protein
MKVKSVRDQLEDIYEGNNSKNSDDDHDSKDIC